MYVCMYVCMYIYIYMYACMYVCMYVCIMAPVVRRLTPLNRRSKTTYAPQPPDGKSTYTPQPQFTPLNLLTVRLLAINLLNLLNLLNTHTHTHTHTHNTLAIHWQRVSNTLATH